MQNDLLRMMGASPVFLVLLACSVFTLGATIERFLYFAKRRGDPDTTLRKALAAVEAGNSHDAVRVCQATPHPFGHVALTLFREGITAEATVEERMQVALSEQKLLLEKNIGVLGTMAAIAPLIGLLGTVWGIMHAFHDMAMAGSAGPSVVAAGIAEALFTTATGIIIAVPALVLYNHLSRRMSTMLTVAENHSRRLRVALTEGSRAGHSHATSPRASDVREARPASAILPTREPRPAVTR
ncbi:MAG: MotA/TolQ/ExbB proton channel family protein [bacterium]